MHEDMVEMHEELPSSWHSLSQGGHHIDIMARQGHHTELLPTHKQCTLKLQHVVHFTASCMISHTTSDSSCGPTVPHA